MKTNREAYLDDPGRCGFVDFLSAGGAFVDQFIPALWSKDAKYLGKSHSALNVTKFPRTIQRRCTVNEFCFGGNGSIGDIALRAKSNDMHWAAGRVKCAQYMRQFAYYFSAEFILEKLINVILQDDALLHFANVLLPDLQSHRGGEANSNKMSASAAGGDSFRDLTYVADEDFMYHFQHDFALRFLSTLDICRFFE